MKRFGLLVVLLSFTVFALGCPKEGPKPGGKKGPTPKVDKDKKVLPGPSDEDAKKKEDEAA